MRLLFTLLLLFTLGNGKALAQGQDSVNYTFSSTQPEINRGKLRAAIITQSALYLGSMAYLQFVWYKDSKRVPFTFYNDSKGYLQIDKFGHAYGAYLESYLSYKWLRSAGVSKKKAMLFGGSAGFFLQLPIEIFDGMYENWGFSWSDVAANAAGSALVVGQEMLFNRQLLQFKFSFYRSVYAGQSNGYLGNNALESLFLDYNGHTYWLSMNVNEVVFKDCLPGWINLAVGYSANGMYGEFSNRTSYQGVGLPQVERYRQFLLSPDIDWTKIPVQSKFLKGVFQALNFIKLPAPALEINSKGKLKLYGLYF